MKTPLRVLIAEDNVTDADLILRELRRAGYEPAWERVDSEPAYLDRLHADLDIILSDYNMPQFGGTRALELLQERGLEVPFIIISGTIGEEVAVEAMKMGAADYLLKDRLTRLGPAVALALNQSCLRKETERAENDMRQSEHKYRHLFESLSAAAFLIDRPTGRILDVNLCAEKLLGRTRAEILGMEERKLFPARENAEHGYTLTEAASTTPQDHWEESSLATKDGRQVPVQISVTPIELYGRQLVLALLTDITERRRADDTLRAAEKEKHLAYEASRLKSEFLANMSHELRTPLNCIIGFTEFLVDEKPGPLNPKQKEYLTDVYNSSKHLLQLINDVLDLAKVEAGKTELHLESFSLAKAIDEVCAIVKGIAQKKGLQVRSAIARDFGSVTLDQQKFKQICYNLLANAVKFTDSGGHVEIGAQSIEGGRFEVWVTDTGIGIRPEDMSRLFREFEQLESGSARRFEGTGLGLALTRKLVEAHGGSITARSEHGLGSTFSVILPRIAAEVVR